MKIKKVIFVVIIIVLCLFLIYIGNYVIINIRTNNTYGEELCTGHKGEFSPGTLAYWTWTCPYCSYKNEEATKSQAMCYDCAEKTNRCTTCGKRKI